MKNVLLSFFALCQISSSQDWPRYLGLEGNGITSEKIRTEWKDEAPPVLWTADIGKGCSSIVIADGLAVTVGNSDDQDIVWCFDAMTGKVKWKDTYPEKLAPKFYTGGPGATPTIDGTQLYVLSKSGRLACYDLKTGKIQWTKNYRSDFSGKAPTWGYTTK